MITNDDISEWFSTIPVSDFEGVQAKHVYAMAEIAYKKGFEDYKASLVPVGVVADYLGVVEYFNYSSELEGEVLYALPKETK